MENLLINIISIVAGLVGVFLAFRSIQIKRMAEEQISMIIKAQKDYINGLTNAMLERSQEITEEVKKNMANELKEGKENSAEILLTKEQAQEVLNYIITLTNNLNKKEKNEILESLDQKSVKAKTEYLNKLLHMSGSTSNIVIKDIRVN